MLDTETTGKLVQSAIIGGVAVALFFGLRGRLNALARWAKLSPLALTPARFVLRSTILIAATVLILSRWGFQTNGLVALLGAALGIIGIGFVASWSTLSHVLSTVALVVLKPFNLGDELELPGNNVRGRVVDLTVVFTTLESAPGETILVPNTTFFQTVVKRRAGAATAELEHPLNRR
ncbi:MAG: mechanosensitive ion channel family protein [Opitutaceae bacterium]